MSDADEILKLSDDQIITGIIDLVSKKFNWIGSMLVKDGEVHGMVIGTPTLVKEISRAAAEGEGDDPLLN